MMRSTSPCVDGRDTNATRKPVYRRTTTLKLGAAVGDRGQPTYIPPKTKGSRRTVPLPAATTNLLRNYVKRHPHRADRPLPCSRACGSALPNLLAKTADS